MQPRDLDRTLRRLARGGWLESARGFASALRTAGHEPGRLIVVGSAEEEPWHLAAHLDDAARWRGLPALRPVLARWHVPDGAPPHLSVGMDAVHRASRGTTVLIATPHDAADDLLERVEDARRGGATLFALHPGRGPLADLAHESLALPDSSLVVERFEAASHVVSSPALEQPRRRRWPGRSAPD